MIKIKRAYKGMAGLALRQHQCRKGAKKVPVGAVGTYNREKENTRLLLVLNTD